MNETGNGNYRDGAVQISNRLSETANNVSGSIQNLAGNVSETASSIGNSVQNLAGNVSESMGNITNSANNLKTSFGTAVSDFSAKGPVEASREFLDSNSIIAKFVFLILILIGFMYLINLGIYLIGYFSQPNKSPYLVSGLITGNTPLIITQDPTIKTSATIYRSNNQQNGIECTWSVWLLIMQLPPSTSPTYAHIFNKGDTNWDTTSGISKVNNAPGLYLSKSTNSLRIVMDTMDQPTGPTVVDISNIPLQKWFHVAIRLQNNLMDTYINGTITNRTQFTNVPKQNYNNVNVCQNGGFAGNMSDLRYFDRDLNVFDINNLVVAGPNMTSSAFVANATSIGVPYYLSNMWYGGNNLGNSNT